MEVNDDCTQVSLNKRKHLGHINIITKANKEEEKMMLYRFGPRKHNKKRCEWTMRRAPYRAQGIKKKSIKAATMCWVTVALI